MAVHMFLPYWLVTCRRARRAAPRRSRTAGCRCRSPAAKKGASPRAGPAARAGSRRIRSPMPSLSRPAALLAALALALAAGTARADTKLRVFVGGQQRPDVMRPLLDRFQQQNPGTTVQLEVGGATSEAQQQYLTTVLSSADSSIDVMLIDVVRPAEYAAAGWAEPLDSYLGPDKDALLARYLPAYRDADVVGPRH